MTRFESNIISLYGNSGREWLDKLPAAVAGLAGKYGLSQLKPIQDLNYNYVVQGLKGERPIVLKLGFDVNSLKQEAVALRAFAGFGAIEVIAEEECMLLLERAVPGDSLKTYFPDKEEQAIKIFCGVVERLHQTPNTAVGSFPHIRDWLSTLDKVWDIQEAQIQKARRLRDSLLRTSSEERLLHGDLHHENILQAGKTWVVIDPKGVIGEPAYELAAFIRNPMPDLLTLAGAPNIIAHRIHSFADVFALSKERLLNWCFVQAVLAWAWALEEEDRDGIEYFKTLTETFNTLTL